MDDICTCTWPIFFLVAAVRKEWQTFFYFTQVSGYLVRNILFFKSNFTIIVITVPNKTFR